MLVRCSLLTDFDNISACAYFVTLFSKDRSHIKTIRFKLLLRQIKVCVCIYLDQTLAFDPSIYRCAMCVHNKCQSHTSSFCYTAFSVIPARSETFSTTLQYWRYQTHLPHSTHVTMLEVLIVPSPFGTKLFEDITVSRSSSPLSDTWLDHT